MKKNGEKIIQVIPVIEEVFAVYTEDNGDEYWERILFAVLAEEAGYQYIRFAEVDSCGAFGFPEEAANFVRYVIPGKTVKCKK